MIKKGIGKIALLTTLIGFAGSSLSGCFDYIDDSYYSCKRNYRGAITASHGEKKAMIDSDEDWDSIISYRNMTREEALEALDICVNAFKEYDEKKKSID